MGFSLSLFLGGAPAPGWLMAALDSVEVTQSDQAPNGFQITFTSSAGTEADDYKILKCADLQAGKRIAVSTSINNATTVLMDGYVTHLQLQPGGADAEARILVTGEDISVLMDFYEYSLEYPLMPDFAIAGTVLLKWMAFGITPVVHPTPTSGLSFTDVPQQVGTDRKYLMELAGAHGYVFHVSPGASVGDNNAYWGPPQRDASPQRALSIDQAGFSTVSEISFAYDATTPQRVWGAVLNTTTNLVVPVMIAHSTRSGDLAASPQLDDPPDISGVPFVRTTLFDHQGLGVVTSVARAQAIVNVASDAVVTATGRLDALRYGGALTAPGVVPLRGAGHQFDGLYYVQKVKHTLSRTAYDQEFVLIREGLGSTLSSVDAA
jgi:hypothetical protein